jgi:hypothetical protein
MKCRRCKEEFEFTKEHRKIIAMAAVCRVYNPNHLCKECREYARKNPRSF